jgi:colanic acid/amylovoran biosynthesis protein
MAEVTERIGPARFTLSLNRGSPAHRRKLGLSDLLWRPSRSRLVSAAHEHLASAFATLPKRNGELMPDMQGGGRLAAGRRWLASAYASRSVHSVLPEQVDCVLDISGFCYADAWGPSGAELVDRYYRLVKRGGGRVVLMPQTFGPFSNPRLRSAFLSIYAKADLVFARDAESFRHVAALVPDTAKLRQAPDFTTLTRSTRGGAGWAEGKACIIPNARMITHRSPEAASAYLPFLRRVLAALRRMGIEAFMLIHEHWDDEAVARDASGGVGDVDVVVEEDALRIKEIIGCSLLTVSSRLHGLINALSQGVPTIATAWAHKYPGLMQEYGVGEFLLEVDASDERIEAALGALVSPETRADIVARLARGEADRVAQTRAMWDQVTPLLAKVPR